MSVRALTLLTAFLVAALVAPPAATAQALDGQWLEVTVSFKGRAVTPSGEVGQAQDKLACYVAFAIAEPDDGGGAQDGLTGTFYDYQVFSEAAPGTWQLTSVGQLFAAGEHEQLALGPLLAANSAGVQWQVFAPGGTSIVVSFIADLKLVFDKQGDLKKAVLKSSGALVAWGNDGADALGGGAKVKGRLVSVDDLPFEAG